MRRRAMAAAAAAVLTAVGMVATVLVPDSPAAAHPVNAADFQQVELARGVGELGEPMSMAVLPDRSVLHTARNGVLRRTTAAGVTTAIGTLPVYTHDEEGLQGVGVDPGFSSNRFIYLFYAPPLSTPGGDAPATGTDLTDEQWEIIEPMLPLIKEPGRVPKHPFRDIVDAILYLDRSGCSWRQLPVGFPPWQTVYGWFRQWKARGVTEWILDELREQVRLTEGRDAEPAAGVIDSQSVKGADTVGRDTRGYDAGKRVNGRKRFIVTDTLGHRPSRSPKERPATPGRDGDLAWTSTGH